MRFQILVQNPETKVKTFISKETNKTLNEIKRVIEELKVNNKVLYFIISDKQVFCVSDPNNFNQIVTLTSKKRGGGNPTYTFPSCFHKNMDVDVMVEFDENNDEFGLDKYFFGTKMYNVKYPLLTEKSIISFYNAFFIENEVSQSVFDLNFGTEDEDCLNYADIMERMFVDQDSINFINGQTEFIENMIIGGIIPMKKPITTFKEFFKRFIVDEPRQEPKKDWRQRYDMFGTDKYDFMNYDK